MKNRFSVREASHDYQLVDNVTGRSACMGDGVDRELDDNWLEFTGENPARSNAPPIGSEGFRQMWENEANADFESYFEAYFPSLYDLVIYDNDRFIDRFTVILGRSDPLERSMQACANLHEYLGLSSDPDSPQGFSQYGHADPGFMARQEENERIHFLDLPKNVQVHLARRLENE